MPKLRFYWDETPDRVDRIEALLAEIHEDREKSDEALQTDDLNDIEIDHDEIS
jgi:hypothetical protein